MKEERILFGAKYIEGIVRMMWMSSVWYWIVLLGVSPSTFLFGCKGYIKGWGVCSEVV